MIKKLLIIPALIFLAACDDSNEATSVHSAEDPIQSEEIQETPIPEKVDWEAVDRLFPMLDDSPISLQIIPREETSYIKIETLLADQLYNDHDGEDGLISVEGIGRFQISASHIGYLVYAVVYSKKIIGFRVFEKNRKEFTSDFIRVAENDGDGGEEMSTKCWIIDVDHDGIPELIKRTIYTNLEPEDDENERDTYMDDVEVLRFSEDLGTYVQQKNIPNQQELNNIYTLDLTIFGR